MNEGHGLFDWELPNHPKWAPLSDGAFRLGISAILWARHPERIARRPGFVPEWMMAVLSRKPKTQTAKLVAELVAAGENLHDAGILEPVEGGWMVHDFEQYGAPVLSAPTAQAATVSSAKAEAGRLGGLRSAEARRLANGTAQPKQNLEAHRSRAEAQSEVNLEAGPKHGVDNLSGSPSDLLSDQPKPSEGETPVVPTAASKAPTEAEPAELDEKGRRRSEASEAERGKVREVFEFWQQDTGHTGAFFDKKRGNRILARLRENKTVDDLKQAIRNRRNDPHLMGTSVGGDGKVYDGIETLLRDNGQVERLMALTEPLRPRSRAGAAATGENFERARARVERHQAEERRLLEKTNATQ